MGGDKESKKVKKPVAAAFFKVEAKDFKVFVQKHTSASKDDNVIDNNKPRGIRNRRAKGHQSRRME